MNLLIWNEYMLNGRSGLAREKAHSKAFAGKPAHTIYSCSICAESISVQIRHETRDKFACIRVGDHG